MFNKLTLVLLSLLLVAGMIGCSIISPTGTPSHSQMPSPSVSQIPKPVPESYGLESSSSPTSFAFAYNAKEFLYRHLAYVGSDNTDNEKAFNDLKLNTNDFKSEKLESGIISTSGVHKIDGIPAFSFLINADSDEHVFEIVLTMYPEFIALTTKNGSALYPYLITYTICAALECDADQARSSIVKMMSDETGAQTGKYKCESKNVYYTFMNTDASSIFIISVGGEGVLESSLE